MGLKDSELIAGIKADDQDVIQEFVRRFTPIFRKGIKNHRSEFLIRSYDEVVNYVANECVNSIKRNDNIINLAGYCYRIMKRGILRFADKESTRRQKEKLESDSQGDSSTPERSIFDIIPDDKAVSPEDIVLGKEQIERIRKCFQVLTAVQKQTVTRILFEGKSVAEIAEIRHVTYHASWQICTKAIDRLKECVDGQE